MVILVKVLRIQEVQSILPYRKINHEHLGPVLVLQGIQDIKQQKRKCHILIIHKSIIHTNLNFKIVTLHSNLYLINLIVKCIRAFKKQWKLFLNHFSPIIIACKYHKWSSKRKSKGFNKDVMTFLNNSNSNKIS